MIPTTVDQNPTQDKGRSDERETDAERQFDVTLLSIGDAVIVTDADGRRHAP